MKRRKNKDMRNDSGTQMTKENAGGNAKPSTAVAGSAKSVATSADATSAKTKAPLLTSTSQIASASVTSAATPSATSTSTAANATTTAASPASSSASKPHKSKMFKFLNKGRNDAAHDAERQRLASVDEALRQSQRDCEEHKLMRVQYEKELYEANITIAQLKQSQSEVIAARDALELRCSKQQARIEQLESEQSTMHHVMSKNKFVPGGVMSRREPSFCPEF
jgi:hypothetical protein